MLKCLQYGEKTDMGFSNFDQFIYIYHSLMFNHTSNQCHFFFVPFAEFLPPTFFPGPPSAKSNFLFNNSSVVFNWSSTDNFIFLISSDKKFWIIPRNSFLAADSSKRGEKNGIRFRTLNKYM